MRRMRHVAMEQPRETEAGEQGERALQRFKYRDGAQPGELSLVSCR